MREVVEREYPDHEKDKPMEDREGHIPVSIKESLDAFLSEEDRPRKKLRLFNDKNSTPGDKASTLSTCLDHLRPHTMTVDRSAASSTDPGSMSSGAMQRFQPKSDKEHDAVDRYGDLKIDVKGWAIVQFHSKYFSQILPFVIPRMMSGPDFFLSP